MDGKYLLTAVGECKNNVEVNKTTANASKKRRKNANDKFSSLQMNNSICMVK